MQNHELDLILGVPSSSGYSVVPHPFREQILALPRHRALGDCPVQGLQSSHSQAVIAYLLSLLCLSSFARTCYLKAANVLQSMYKSQTHLPMFPLVLPAPCMGAAGSVLSCPGSYMIIS